MPQYRETAGLGASMAEEAEGQDTGAEASAFGVDSAALDIALRGAVRNYVTPDMLRQHRSSHDG